MDVSCQISVIIPSYKPQGYLWKCLDSLDCQTFLKQNFEIILVLNGCCEPYQDQINNYIACHEMNIMCIQTDISGVSNARNVGLNYASGEFIVFIDDDDFVSETYLSKLYRAKLSNGIVLSNRIDYVEHVDKYIQTYDEYGKLDVKKAHNVPTTLNWVYMKLIPRNLIGPLRFDVSLTNGEDTLFMFALSRRIKGYSWADKDAVYYRRWRMGSAFSSKKTIVYICRARFLLVWKYTRCFLSNPLKFDLIFYFMRVAGALRSIFLWQNNIKKIMQANYE